MVGVSIDMLDKHLADTTDNMAKDVVQAGIDIVDVHLSSG